VVAVCQRMPAVVTSTATQSPAVVDARSHAAARLRQRALGGRPHLGPFVVGVVGVGGVVVVVVVVVLFPLPPALRGMGIDGGIRAVDTRCPAATIRAYWQCLLLLADVPPASQQRRPPPGSAELVWRGARCRAPPGGCQRRGAGEPEPNEERISFAVVNDLRRSSTRSVPRTAARRSGCRGRPPARAGTRSIR
jgi:hypothetical protein